MCKLRPSLKRTEDILAQLDYIRRKKQEYFVCLSVDSAQRLIRRRIIAIGILDAVQTHPREVFAGPIVDRAAYIIVAHNHPSGDPNPSRRDVTMTQQLVGAGILLGVPVHDHVITTQKTCYSFRGEGLLSA
jgi:DNA repair protein RadC